MKKHELTGQQMYELKWFARNTIDINQEFYKIREQVDAFSDKLERLIKSCKAIENYLDEELKPFEKVDWSKVPAPMDKGEKE